jgi:hypothetical protein
MDQQAQERIAIVKDALKWIKAGALIPKAQYEVVAEISPHNEQIGKPLRDVNLGKCQVCMMGALFLGQAVRDINCTIEALLWGQCRDKLRSYFSQEQLDLIEVYFEGRVYNWNTTTLHKGFDEDEKAHQFLQQHPNDSKRMKLILRNIVKNNGIFVPEQLTEV